jgi:plastocyanin
MPGRLAVIVAGGVMALVSACGSSSSPTASSGGGASSGGATLNINGQSANNHGTKDVSGGGSQDVEVDNNYFSPTVFTGHPGDKLTLTLSNESTTLHNFSVSEQNLDMDIAGGAKITATVTFPSSGTLVFFCKYHRSSGMLGGLQVETGG